MRPFFSRQLSLFSSLASETRAKAAKATLGQCVCVFLLAARYLPSELPSRTKRPTGERPDGWLTAKRARALIFLNFSCRRLFIWQARPPARAGIMRHTRVGAGNGVQWRLTIVRAECSLCWQDAPKRRGPNEAAPAKHTRWRAAICPSVCLCWFV